MKSLKRYLPCKRILNHLPTFFGKCHGIFLSNFARSHSKASIITFDQLLYWKGENILSATEDVFLKNVVLVLGPFHTQMNFLGCVGTLMANSGLSDILEEIYGENAVHHILLGKAYSRAIRGHFLVDLDLNTILIKHMITKDDGSNKSTMQRCFNYIRGLALWFSEIKRRGNTTRLGKY